MNTRKLLIGSALALLPVAGAIAADGKTQKGPDATSASIATLKANLGNAAGFEVDEVRLTDAGVACIDYRVKDAQGSRIPGHAVIQGSQVLKSSSDDKKFEAKWNEHCLGPRGGMSDVK